jgi:phosphohistidine phosphatase
VELLVVRHAIALDKDEANERGVPDAERPLTKDGRRRMKRVARGLARSVPKLSAIFSSPWLRAAETAALLRERFSGVESIESDALLPDAEPEALAECLMEYLAGRPATSALSLVGHEPHLSTWVSWCLTGQPSSILELRKAGACLVRFADTVGAGQGKLLWLMPPAVLRQL